MIGGIDVLTPSSQQAVAGTVFQPPVMLFTVAVNGLLLHLGWIWTTMGDCKLQGSVCQYLTLFPFVSQMAEIFIPITANPKPQ